MPVRRTRYELVATQVRFDFDPLDLKDPHTESVSTLFDLMKDPDFNPYTIDILGPSLENAEQLANQIKQLRGRPCNDLGKFYSRRSKRHGMM